MLKIDSHTHPFQQRRCYEELVLFAETALAKGFDGIIFTEHAPMCVPTTSHHLNEKELELYLELGEECRKQYRGKLDILVGIEADYFPENLDYQAELIEKYRIPYVGGSLHFHLPFWASVIGNASPEKRMELALQQTFEMVKTGLYRTVNHLDFFRWKYPGYQPECYRDSFCALFEEMVRRDVALEWNSSGLRKEFASVLPCPEVWKWSLDYPLKRTFGSDAHQAVFLGSGWEDYFRETMSL